VLIVGYLAAALGGYLLGSVPTGYLVAKGRGVDIRSVGSGNIGATNVFRALGVAAGVFVLLVDAVKGVVPVVAARLLWRGWDPSASALTAEWAGLVAGFCAVLGHNYTCWLRFKGGKGIATSAGVLAALVPGAFLILLGVFAGVLLATRYVSLASISAALTLPFAVWATAGSLNLIVVTAVLGALAVYKHKANIRRLLNGTENRLGKPRPEAADVQKR
jgi:glycerol-3-phosphate acyltransferase PlsY